MERGQAARLRASCRRTAGVRHMIAALDLATGQMTYRIRQRKRWRELLSFLKLVRQRWPGQKLYVIMDNFSPHKHPQVLTWAAANGVELVFLPAYASWAELDRIRGSRPCGTSRSTAPITAPTPSKATRSPGTCAGATPAPGPSATSPRTQ